MPVLMVGATEIPYSIRYSTRAKRLSIRVTSELVEAVAPESFPIEMIDSFVKKKRQWVYHKVENMAELEEKAIFPWPERFVTGAKIPFHGRNMKLRVIAEDINRIGVAYRHEFLVRKPCDASDCDVRAALEKWLCFRLMDEVRDLIEHYTRKLRVAPGLVTVSPLKTRWGSCGRNGSIRVNWLLVMAPKPILEYVVVHELCHLRHRNHSSEFWSMVASCLPDYEASRKWLSHIGRFMSL